MKKNNKMNKKNKQVIGGLLLFAMAPMFVYAFVGTDFLPISEETFIGAWLGAILAIYTTKGIELLVLGLSKK